MAHEELMTHYRRSYIPGGTYFFMVVTYIRQPIFTSPIARKLLRDSWLTIQRKFWEHTFNNQDDLNAHINYIHYNPVKHGLVRSAVMWPWSTFYKYVERSAYYENWGKRILK